PVLGEDRGIKAALHQIHVQEPAVEQVVLEFFAEGALAAYRVQGNRQRGLGSRSGGTEARPTEAYMRSNSGDNRSRAASATALIRRNGWSRGIRSSRSTMASMLRWGLGRPRIREYLRSWMPAF
ncbi:MAG: hypothetical protein OXC13_00760, partial [Caldilineaceae bacterium]|nr:hypothetical protein [Caldilineaceae bacterium]